MWSQTLWHDCIIGLSRSWFFNFSSLYLQLPNTPKLGLFQLLSSAPAFVLCFNKSQSVTVSQLLLIDPGEHISQQSEDPRLPHWLEQVSLQQAVGLLRALCTFVWTHTHTEAVICFHALSYHQEKLWVAKCRTCGPNVMCLSKCPPQLGLASCVLHTYKCRWDWRIKVWQIYVLMFWDFIWNDHVFCKNPVN